jgi:hypothetical protein
VDKVGRHVAGLVEALPLIWIDIRACREKRCFK